MSHKKFGPDRFSRFDVYWTQTDRQTDKQTDKPNLYIDLQLILNYYNWHGIKNFQNVFNPLNTYLMNQMYIHVTSFSKYHTE